MAPQKNITITKVKQFFGFTPERAEAYSILREDIKQRMVTLEIKGKSDAGNVLWGKLLDATQKHAALKQCANKFRSEPEEARKRLSVLCADIATKERMSQKKTDEKAQKVEEERKAKEEVERKAKQELAKAKKAQAQRKKAEPKQPKPAPAKRKRDDANKPASPVKRKKVEAGTQASSSSVSQLPHPISVHLVVGPDYNEISMKSMRMMKRATMAEVRRIAQAKIPAGCVIEAFYGLSQPPTSTEVKEDAKISITDNEEVSAWVHATLKGNHPSLDLLVILGRQDEAQYGSEEPPPYDEFSEDNEYPW